MCVHNTFHSWWLWNRIPIRNWYFYQNSCIKFLREHGFEAESPKLPGFSLPRYSYNRRNGWPVYKQILDILNRFCQQGEMKLNLMETSRQYRWFDFTFRITFRWSFISIFKDLIIKGQLEFEILTTNCRKKVLLPYYFFLSNLKRK